MQRQIIYLALSLMFWNVSSNAQDKIPPELNQLVAECQNVVALNDTINARQERLNDLKGRLELIKQSWWQSCHDALSSSNCDSKDIRLATLDELISLTDPIFEAELLAQLIEAKKNPAIWTLSPITHTTPLGSKSTRQPGATKEGTPQREPAAAPVQTTPGAGEQPKDERSKKKDNSSTSPRPKDAKERSDEQAAPDRQGTRGREDKSSIDSKGETNRNKTINTVKDKLNTNK